jgi:glycosyltransferase involved in cell wall biosynthesis
MRIAVVTTDNREHHRSYGEAEPRFGPAIEAVLQGLAQLPELEIHVISCTQQPMRAPEKLSENTWFHLLNVPKIGWLRTGYQGCIRAIRRKLQQLQPDLVHGQGTERECAISAAFSGFPNVVTLHGIMTTVAKAMRAGIGSYLWCSSVLERFTLSRTLGVFCNSSYTESVVKERAHRTWLVPNAVRRDFFEISLPLRAAPSKPILLNVGAISPYKRQLEVLNLAENLYREGHSFELHFIGAVDSRNNKYGAAFLDRIKAAEHNGFARHIGTRSLPDLIACFDAATALIHVPSEEAFGLVVAEALSRNLKFFGTAVGGITDIAQAVEGAELFPLNDERSLQLAIANWLRKNCARPRTAATEMRQRYYPEVIAKQHLEIYREILGHGA